MTKPEKLGLQSADVTRTNVEVLAELFPGIVTEGHDDDGNLVHQIDWESLRQELSDYVVEGAEVYQIDWPGKRAAEFLSNTPTTTTLRPTQDSVEFETTTNLFIEGDNLEALKLLQESYLGKVRLIYIDPPYNTGGDLVYRDDFSSSKQEYLWKSQQVNDSGEKLVSNTESNGRFHSDWLSMIYPRLRLAKRFLAQDGVILVSIDDWEQASLRRLMDEVFGQQNFIAQLVWEKGRKNDAKLFSVGHEYVLVYAKSQSTLREMKTKWREEKPGAREIWDYYLELRRAHGQDEDSIERDLGAWFKSLPSNDPSKKWARYKRVDANGPWRDQDISWPGGDGPRYEVIHPATKKACRIPERGWVYSQPEKMQQMVDLGVVVFRDDETEPPFRKAHLRPLDYELIADDDADEEAPDEAEEDAELATQVRGTYLYKQSQVSVRHLRNLMGAKVFNNPKDHEELSRLFEYVLSGKGGIVMDFFAGSGTTAEAVFDLCSRTGLNCPVVLVQLPELLEQNLKSAKGSAKTTIQNAIKLLEKLGKPLTISELTKIRITKAGAATLDARKPSDWNGDIGFRAFTIDTTNKAIVETTPDSTDQQQLAGLIDTFKPDRSSIDILFEVLLDSGLDLSSSIATESVGKREVLNVDDGFLLACLDAELDDEVVRAIATRKPEVAVFKDSGFGNDDARINAMQIFHQLSSDTVVKVL
jgi:adenine-specific DNA-methyltransferase